MASLFNTVQFRSLRCITGLCQRMHTLALTSSRQISNRFSSDRATQYPVASSSFLEHGRLSIPLYQNVRYSTIFTATPADQLWEGVTGPKGSTKKRARGKRRVTRPKIDLHRGQRLGVGKAGMEWPGLNVGVLHNTSVRAIKVGEVNEAYFERLQELRNKSAVKKKRLKLPPLLRGWTGSRLEGQSIGPPSPEHPDFDTRVIEMKAVSTMTATVGRYRRFSVLVATGNGRGLCGIGKAKAITLTAAVRRAKQRAAQNLVAFHLRDDRTCSGLVCHRLIRTLCKIIGIKDMYAKVEGSTKNYQVITRGFLRLLSEQHTYSELANRLGLNVVEFDADRDLYPILLANPAPGCAREPASFADILPSSKSNSSKFIQQRQSNEPLSILTISHPERHRPRRPPLEKHESFLDDLIEIGEEPSTPNPMEELLISGERDLDVLVLGGRVPVIRSKPKPFYWKTPGNLRAAELRFKFRNHDAARRQRAVYAALDELAA